MKSQEFENKTGNRSLLDQENLRRLTVEFEIDFENKPEFHNYAYIKCTGRKMGLSYGKPTPLAARLTNDNLFVMEGMPIPSMHVAKSEVEEIRWVYNQISGIERGTMEIAIVAPKPSQVKLCRILEKSYISINNKKDERIHLLSEPRELPANIARLYWLGATEKNVFPDTNMSEKRKQLILIKRLVSDNIFVSKVGSDTNFADVLIQYL